MNGLNDVVVAWLGLLFGMTGVGVMVAFIFRWLARSTGGLR